MKFTALLLLGLAFSLSGFYDDSEDNDISDWEERGNPASWWAEAGCINGYTDPYVSVCEMVPLDFGESEDVIVETLARGIHNFGLCARYDENDTGLVAYVSPDNNVARIRTVGSGTPGPIHNSLYEDFPEGVWYQLTLVCAQSNLSFFIEVPSTGQSWVLTAQDPEPQSGTVGVHMAMEQGASWDWFSAQAYTGLGQTAASTVVLGELEVYPNPFTESVAITLSSGADQGSVAIFDLAGRLVQSVPYSSDDGQASVTWDGTSTSGRPVPVGVYFAREAGSSMEPVRLVRVR
ncbi:MAG: T9SS type A sorting domain-containing protein [Candidatus Aegiribacteria sp.]|nr:T9SS type A sorting domain-containing protein [Candidatus Aegiribacteria sp.]MBD3294299.1 T9SS type A sorting domain-containing protein [Candidatus Fermentibacteria bacterium]